MTVCFAKVVKPEVALKAAGQQRAPRRRGGEVILTLHVNSSRSEATSCLHAAGSPLEASTCGCSHKPFRSLNVGVKGWGLAGWHGVDYRGPNGVRTESSCSCTATGERAGGRTPQPGSTCSSGGTPQASPLILFAFLIPNPFLNHHSPYRVKFSFLRRYDLKAPVHWA